MCAHDRWCAILLALLIVPGCAIQGGAHAVAVIPAANTSANPVAVDPVQLQADLEENLPLEFE